MSVLLVRHGEAASSQGIDDDRILSLRGRDEVRSIARALTLRSMTPALMLASPLVRAVQTAELLASGLGYEGVVAVDRALEPHGDVIRAQQLIASATGLVVVVTHEPFVRVLAGALTGQSSVSAFRTAECALIDGGRLVLRLDPDST